MKSDFEKLTDDERERFESLARERRLPETLEDNIVAELKKENLIRSPKPKQRGFRFRLNPIFASCLGLFVIGISVWGVWYFAFSSPENKMPQFILFLHESSGHAKSSELSAEELDQLSEDYAEWTSVNRQSGILKEGDNLEDEIRILDLANDQQVVSEKSADPKEDLIIGWFIIRAPNFNEAVKIAKTCPHYQFGRIEVRRIEDPRLN